MPHRLRLEKVLGADSEPLEGVGDTAPARAASPAVEAEDAAASVATGAEPPKIVSNTESTTLEDDGLGAAFGAAAALEQRRKKLPAQKIFCTLYFPAKFSVSLTALGSLKKRPGAALPLTGVCPEQPLLGICLGTRVSPPITVRLASFLFTNRTQFNDDL